MRLDPTLTVDDWNRFLYRDAVATWGETWARDHEEGLRRLASAIQRVVLYPLAAEEEPFLLAAEPFLYEEH